ncbi:MAG: hypothetical protein IT198_17775 [Acidimicrobiia bacterium]|nr:hypothetical protein [Acidimicrobiia bacterium]
MTEARGGAPDRARHRRRPHKAPATRLLAAGLSTSATVALVSAMAATAPPDAADGAGPESPWPVSYIEDGLVSTGASPAQKVIRIEIHRKVYVPASSPGTVTARPGTDHVSSGGTRPSSSGASRVSRSSES